MSEEYHQLFHDFREKALQQFHTGFIYGWVFGLVKIDDKDQACIKVEMYQRNTPHEQLKRYAEIFKDRIEVRFVLPPENERMADIFILGDIPAFMVSLDDNFTHASLKSIFLANASKLGYGPEQIATVMSEDEAFAFNLFAGPAETLAPVPTNEMK